MDEKNVPKIKQSSCGRAVRDFCNDTTLHGFKYLVSKNYYDRVGWLLCCCASACCAGVLCSVLWARFLQVPALLTVHDLRGQLATVRLPLVAVCPSADSVAYYFQNNLSIDKNIKSRLPIILTHVLQKKKTPRDQLILLEDFLVNNNLTLPKALMKVTPPCHEIVRNCRWQFSMMPCEELFTKEMTEWGACCISRPYDQEISKIMASRMDITRRLSIAVQCSEQSTFNGCEFFTKFDGEEWVELTPLTPGHSYLAHITFTSFVDNDPENLIDGTCVAAEGYSRTGCLLKCKERHCGCSEPLRNDTSKDKNILPPCFVTQLGCLRDFKMENNTCNCLPSCKKVFTYMALESSPMNAFEYAKDDIYIVQLGTLCTNTLAVINSYEEILSGEILSHWLISITLGSNNTLVYLSEHKLGAGLNPRVSSILRIAVRVDESRLYVVNPTETWITLLSSLGGVFNMFLGVGLFSALEILFLIFVRLPIAIRGSSHIVVSPDI